MFDSDDFSRDPAVLAHDLSALRQKFREKYVFLDEDLLDESIRGC